MNLGELSPDFCLDCGRGYAACECRPVRLCRHATCCEPAIRGFGYCQEHVLRQTSVGHATSTRFSPMGWAAYIVLVIAFFFFFLLLVFVF